MHWFLELFEKILTKTWHVISKKRQLWNIPTLLQNKPVKVQKDSFLFQPNAAKGQINHLRSEFWCCNCPSIEMECLNFYILLFGEITLNNNEFSFEFVAFAISHRQSWGVLLRVNINPPFSAAVLGLWRRGNCKAELWSPFPSRFCSRIGASSQMNTFVIPLLSRIKLAHLMFPMYCSVRFVKARNQARLTSPTCCDVVWCWKGCAEPPSSPCWRP